MTDRIRLIVAADGLRTPHPGSERLYHFAAGTELPLLEDFSRDYFRTAYGGRLMFVAKATSRRVADNEPLPATVVPPPVTATPGSTIENVSFAPTTGERIRVIVPCDGFSAPDPTGRRVFRFEAQSELPLLGQVDDFFRTVFEGETVYVPKTSCYRVAKGDGPFAATAVRAGSVEDFALARAPEGAAVTWVKRIARIVAMYIGVNLVIGGVAAMIAAAPGVISPTDDVGSGYGVGIGGAIALTMGAGFVRAGWRPFMQFVVLLAGVALAVGGFELLVFAVPVSAMSDRSREVVPDRATAAFIASGVSLMIVGVATAMTAFLRWWRNPESRAQLPDVGRWSSIGYGAVLLLIGSAVAGVGTVQAGDFDPTVQDAAAVGMAIPLLLVPGSILGFYGLTSKSQRMSGPFRFVASWPLLLFFGVAVGLGAIAAHIGEPIEWLMTTAHAAAALLPALALIALASRGGLRMRAPVAGVTHRQLWLALAVGVTVVTLAAGTLDTFIAEGFAMVVLGASGAFDGLRTFEGVTDVLRYPDDYLSRGQQAVLLLAIVSIMAPVMEEGFKALGVSLVLPKRATPAAALTLGVAVGAGFGVTEASVYGLGGLADGSDIDWWALMLVRGGATTMHALNTGLLGLALYFGANEGRVRRGLLLYFAAVFNHGLWNAMSVLAGSRVIFEFSALSEHELSMVVFGVMAALGLATFITLHEVARRAYRASPKVVDTLPAPELPQATLESQVGA